MIRLKPDTDLRELVARAFDLSRPQGMGFLHHRAGGATKEEIDACVHGTEARIVASADYLRGRSMKLTVFRDGDGLYVNDRWYDHDDGAWTELLAPYLLHAASASA